MFSAKQIGDVHLAEALMIQMEAQRNSELPKPRETALRSILSLLPPFASEVLGKSQAELGFIERSNCINAAFNFHDISARWEAYSTIDFLVRIQNDFVQLSNSEPFQFGDLAVMWSRTGGSWDGQTIDVHQINREDSEFPYGLVFDHIVVRLTDDLVFHKPDPTHESRYQIDYLTSVIALTVANRGFEVSFHRTKKLAPARR